jgi:hypothetical protein
VTDTETQAPSDIPTAVHLGKDDLPFVDIGGGSKLKVIQVDAAKELWIVENIFQAGYMVQTHRHTGPVYAYTTSGAWRYQEYEYVNRAGSCSSPPVLRTPWSASKTIRRSGSRCTART